MTPSATLSDTPSGRQTPLPVAELVVDDAGNILSVNPAMASLLDIDQSAIEHATWSSLAARSDLSGLIAMALPPFPADPRTTWFRFDDDPPTLGMLAVRAIAWPGADRAAIVTFTPVEHRAEGGSGPIAPALGAPALWFEVAFGSNVVATALLTEHGRHVASNDAMTELVGQGASVLAPEALHPADIEDTVESLEYARTGRAVSIPHRLARTDGSTIVVNSNVMPVMLDGQQYLLVQVTPSAQARHTGPPDTDPVTGLLDAVGVGASIGRCVERRIESGTDFAVVSVDLDDFRGVNAAIGTIAADAVLSEVAACIRSLVPPSSDIGRVVADRFAAIVPETDVDEVTTLAGELVERVARIEPEGLGRPLAARASGVLVATNEQSIGDITQTAEQITQAARLRPDHTMIRTLRDRADTTVTIGESQTREWCRSVETALGSDSFAAVAEPLRPMTADVDHGIDYYELLVRLVLPNGEWMSLPKFERLAARLDRRTHIDRWMVARAVRYLERHPALDLEVNLTRATVHAEDAAGWIAEQVLGAGIDTDRILFAIDERVIVDDLACAAEFTHELRERGLGVCIDSFGGFGGGARELEAIAPRRAKLPGSIVSHSAAERDAAAKLAELVGLARGAGVQTAAVFVSDAEVHDVVKALGVDLAQGWYVGRAVSLEVR